jgi:type II secretory pathway component GspD/PulD (secretin)
MANKYYFRTLAFLLLVSAPLMTSDANASSEWKNAPYQYVIVDQELRSILSEFGRNLNLPVKLSASIKSQRIRGSVNRSVEWTAESFLRNLSDTYGLVWFHDGSVLHIAERNEVETEMLSVKKAKAMEMQKTFAGLDVSNPELTVRVADGGNALAISGPASYRVFVRSAVLAMSKPDAARIAREAGMADHGAVRVFRGGS